MGQPNWANLVQQGRAFAHGVPWNEEQARARALGVPAEYVRRGCLTLDDADKLRKEDEAIEKKTGELPVEALDRDALFAKARARNANVTSDTPIDGLRAVIDSDKPKKASKKK